MAATSDQPPHVASDHPADDDQASESDIPCAACIHLKENQDQDENQDLDRYMVDVRYDLRDAFENLASSEADLRTESHEALRRTLRIWLKRRADETHPREPDYLVNMLQFGYSKDEISFSNLEPDDLATVRCLKDMSAGLGLKVLLVLWKMTNKVALLPDYEDHFEVLQDVPVGASQQWHETSWVLDSNVEVEKLVDLDDEPDEFPVILEHLPESVKDGHELAKRHIQRDGDIFYANHFRKWEDLSSLSWSSPGYCGRGRDGSTLPPSKRPIGTQYYQSCALLLVPQVEFDCFLLSQIEGGDAADEMPWHLDEYKNPETRSRALRALRHLAPLSYGNNGMNYWDDDDIRTETMQIALDNLDYKLFSDMTGEGCSYSHSPVSLGEDVFRAVHKTIAEDAHFKFAKISDGLLAFLKPPIELKTTGTYRYHVLERGVELLWVLAPTGDGVPIRPDVLDWILEAAGPLLLGICRATASTPDTYATGLDGRAIVDLLVRYYPRLSLTRILNGILQPRVDNMSFMLGALAQIDRYVDEGAYDQEEGRTTYRKWAELTIAHIDPPFFRGAGKDRNTTALLDAQNLASLFHNCLKYQWEGPFWSLISLMYKVDLHDDKLDLSDMWEYWVPGFLFGLLHLLPDRETEPSPRLGTTEQQATARSLVHLLQRKYLCMLLLGIIPFDFAPDYWRHPVSCANHCELCNELNSFLQSQQQARSFLYDAPAVRHMTSQIKGCGQCKVVDEPVVCPGESPRDFQHILVVTKIAQTFEQWKAAWGARIAMASEFVAKLKEEPFQTRLDVLFGGQDSSIDRLDWRDFLKTHEHALQIWHNLLDRPLDHLVPAHGSNFPPSLAGSKRKAEDQGGR